MLIGCSQNESNIYNASLFVEGGIDSKGVPNRSKPSPPRPALNPARFATPMIVAACCTGA